MSYCAKQRSLLFRVCSLFFKLEYPVSHIFSLISNDAFSFHIKKYLARPASRTAHVSKGSSIKLASRKHIDDDHNTTRSFDQRQQRASGMVAALVA
jgi:hypothetical protein